MAGLFARLSAAGALALVLLASVFAAAANAADDVTIDHAEHTADGIKLLVSVPGDEDVDLGSVKVTVDGTAVDATAQPANAADDVRRTTVLAIDTSNSMKGARIAAAQAAARTYLDTVPDNVEVGIVTFDNDVVVRQAPSLDRDASRAVIDALTLKLNTALYKGVQTAITATGTHQGQRQVLVLSDGKDNTKTPLQPTIDAIKKSGVKVDAVALDQGAAAPAALAQMAQAGGGEVISANAEALTAAFSNEADALARQILVTAKVPDSQESADATVTVTLDAGGDTHTGSAFVQVKDNNGPAKSVIDDAFKPKPAKADFELPIEVVYGAAAAIGLGIIGLVAALATGSSAPKLSLADQIGAYAATEERLASSRKARARAKAAESSTLAASARQMAENVLTTNRGFEAKIAHRLEGAGMSIKASEWLLVHFGITFALGILFLLLSAGNAIFMLIGLVLGALGPWLYLGFKRSRRLAAFHASLADTLQLMSGSLSAGLSLAQSLDTIVREGTEPVVGEFKRVIAEARLGVGLEDALEGVASRMESKDFKWVVMAIRIQREVGGNLAELLNTVAGTLREREYLRRHVKALSAEGRLSCWILGGLPPVFLLYLALTRWDYVSPLFTEPIGWLMLGGLCVLLTVGIFWMTRVVKVEV